MLIREYHKNSNNKIIGKIIENKLCAKNFFNANTLKIFDVKSSLIGDDD